MVAAALSTPEPATAAVLEERRVLLYDVPWSTYVVLRDSVASACVRMTYWKGQLEIMSPSKEHEVSKKQIARLLELFCYERRIRLLSFGSTTYRREERRGGFEADECYCRDTEKDFPDIAIEVIVTNPLLDKLEVYRTFGVREVWVHRKDAFVVFAFRETGYVELSSSEVLPEIDLAMLARYAAMPDRHESLYAFVDELRKT